MKNKFFATLLIIAIGLPVIAQNDLSNYSFVSVPRKFDFLKNEDQYQLNSLAKFLFNKYGFNAGFPEELSNVNRCDGLYATVIGKPEMIRTKVTVILKDCNGVEVYRSLEGKSKLKAYNKTYTDAMRKAFLGFEELGVNQKEIVITEGEVNNKSEGSNEVVAVVTVSDPKIDDHIITTNIPESKYTPLVKNEETYLLTKTKEGFLLYRDFTATNNDAGLVLQGKVIVDNNRIYFEDLDKIQSKASFDKAGNLVIENNDKTIVYNKQ